METLILFVEVLDEIQFEGNGGRSGALFIATIDSINNP